MIRIISKRNRNIQKSLYHNKGISMISLIIVIIVIIILASIVLFSGLNTPDKANFAKYTQQVDNFQMAVQEEYSRKITYYASNHIERNNAQIYYTIATGSEIDINTKTEDLRAGTIEELGIQTKPDLLQGNEYFEVVVGTSISGKKDEKGLYQSLGTAEKHYITDKGEFFVLPGYQVSEDGNTKWFITAGKYYEGETPITNNVLSEAKIIFNANGGSVSEVIRRVPEGDEIGTLPVPSRYGFLFDGWYTAAEDGTKISANTKMGSETVTYFAHWKAATAEVIGSYYMSLQEAVNAVPLNNSSTTINLLKDISENVITQDSQNIILNLQSHQINNKNSTSVITNNGILTVTNGTIVSSSTSESAINNNQTGTLKVSNLSIMAQRK